MFALSVLAACVPATSQTLPVLPANSPEQSTTAGTAGTSGAQTAGSLPTGSYVLGPGDRVRVIVFGEDRLSGEYAVTSNGEISFPLIGNLKVTGKSVTDIQVAIRDKLAQGYVNDPRVSAEMLSFRPYYVLGEVARPGQYPYLDGLTVQQAIATAGGYTYRAKRRSLYIKGPRSDTERVIDMKKDPGVLVGPGDTLRVGERFF